MHIIQIASEIAPIAKVGGLGDVVYGLSQELCKQGHTVEIILPKYDCLLYDQLHYLQVEQRELWSFDGPYQFNNTIWSANYDGLKLLFVEPHHPHYFFSRGTIYGCHDDIDRFIYFSRVAIEYLYKSNKRVDAIHVHDWPTALIPVLYKEMYQPLGYEVKGTVLTIHNVEHQGRCSPFNLARAGLHAEKYLSPETLGDPHLPNHVNLLKGGVVYADQVTAVSPNYGKEIQTAEGGFGLNEVLVKHQKKITGILNGIDENYWNPKKDPYLFSNYETHSVSKKNLPAVIESKEECKKQLWKRLGLKSSSAPLVATVARLVPQKSPSLIKHALLRTLEKGGQFALLGSSPIPEIQREFEELQNQLKESGNAAICMEKDEGLAHEIFAASDMFIIPSLFEPCGLTQLIALRYGSVPIARVTGGLADTVFDIDTAKIPLEERNGFTFDFPDESGVDWALDRALNCYMHERDKWDALMIQGMQIDFSWKQSAQQYIEIYAQLNSKGRSSPDIVKSPRKMERCKSGFKKKSQELS